MSPAFERFLSVARDALTAPQVASVTEVVATSLANLDAADFGLEGDTLPLDVTEPMRQENLFSEPDLCVGLFLMAAGQQLPLHDHPHMTVWLKVLCGRLRTRSFDWVEKQPGGGLAQLVADREIAPQTAPQVVEAHTGNLHQVRALSDVAFLDVFSPYYSDERPCTYYRPRDRFERGRKLVWLEAVPEEMAWNS